MNYPHDTCWIPLDNILFRTLISDFMTIIFFYFNVPTRFMIGRLCRPHEMKQKCFHSFKSLEVCVRSVSAISFLIAMWNSLMKLNGHGTFFVWRILIMDYSSLIGLFSFLCACACFGTLYFARNLSFQISNFLA